MSRTAVLLKPRRLFGPWGLAVVAAVGMVFSCTGREVTADEPSLGQLLETLRYDPSSPTASIVIRRLGARGSKGLKALASLATDPIDPTLQLEATAALLDGTEPERLDLAARVYKEIERDDIRERVAVALARSYPERAELLHDHLRAERPGALDLLRFLSQRGMPRSEIEALVDLETLGEFARVLLQGRGPTPEVLALLDRARALAGDGLDPARSRAFAAAFRVAPSRSLLRALAEVMREPDERTKVGAHCLLLTAGGIVLPADTSLWLSWLEAQGDTYAVPDVVSPGAVAAAVIRGARHVRADLAPDGTSAHSYKHASSTRTGCTALSVLALRAAGEPADAPVIRRALETRLIVRDAEGRPGLRAYPERYETYALALMAMAFKTLDWKALDVPLAAVHAKLTGGILPNGRWTYTCKPGTDRSKSVGDNSNTQYANLGLRALGRAGKPVPAATWALAEKHWRTTQNGQGLPSPRQRCAQAAAADDGRRDRRSGPRGDSRRS